VSINTALNAVSPNPIMHEHTVYPRKASLVYTCTDKKENQTFLIYKEIQSGAVAKSYMRKGFLIYEEMPKYFPIYEEAVSHYDFATAPLGFSYI
jgi:hypothetical protein